MLKNKRGFLLIEALLFLYMIVIVAFLLVNCITLFANEEKRTVYDVKKEDTLMRQAYE